MALAATTVYGDIRHHVRDGDLALMRNGPPVAWFSGPYTHAAKCLWLRTDKGQRNTLMLCESREFVGGRIVTLSSQVRKFPGRIDLFRPKCPEDVAAFSAILTARQAGHRYGYRDLLRAALKRIPGSARLLLATRRVSSWYEPKDCSHSIAWSEVYAARTHDVEFDPVPGKQPRDVEPVDLANEQHELIYPGLVMR